jgi:hypothetical protein
MLCILMRYDEIGDYCAESMANLPYRKVNFFGWQNLAENKSEQDGCFVGAILSEI